MNRIGRKAGGKKGATSGTTGGATGAKGLYGLQTNESSRSLHRIGH